MAPELASGDEHDPRALLERQRARVFLDDLLDRMPEEQRVVFSLFELEGMTGDDIAELLDVPVGTVRSRLRLAREVFHAAVARIRAQERRCDTAALIPEEAFP
jgi:RNA polymerase sigma-70 factor, ECF subfamily